MSKKRSEEAAELEPRSPDFALFWCESNIAFVVPLDELPAALARALVGGKNPIVNQSVSEMREAYKEFQRQSPQKMGKDDLPLDATLGWCVKHLGLTLCKACVNLKLGKRCAKFHTLAKYEVDLDEQPLKQKVYFIRLLSD